MTREQLAARLAELKTQMAALLGEPSTKPVLTAEEQTQFDALLAEAQGIPDKLKAIEDAEKKAAANRAALAAVKPLVESRRSSTEDTMPGVSQSASVRITSEVMTMEQIRALPQEQRPFVLTAKNGGYRSLGEQLQAIAAAGINGERGVDERLCWQNVVPTMAASGAGAGTPSDGGYLIQKDVMTELNNKAFSGGELLSRVDQIPIGAGSDGLKINTINETSRANGSRWGGVQMYWGAEADAATAKKPTFKQVSMELVDIIGLAYVTDRLLADATALEAVYSKAFLEESIFMKEEGIYNGTGAGQILGFMNSPAKVSVTRTTAARVKYADIVNMWSRMWGRSRMNCVWLINQDIEPDLFQMQFVIQNVAATENVGGSAAYMPPGGLNDAPYGRLMGKPVIPVEYSATLGTTGDIALVDLSEFAYIHKGGAQSDSSIHVRFANNERTFRWIERCNGQPKWIAPVTPAKGTATKSPFIVLT